jgi:TatD DNase family protein
MPHRRSADSRDRQGAAVLYDSHVHLDDPSWPVEQMLGELSNLTELDGAMTAGYGPERFAASRAICAGDPRVVRSLGLHPWWLAGQTPAQRDQGWQALLDELDDGPAVALGEIGLDKGLRARLSLEDQLHWMERGLLLARERELPVVLHIVGWYGRALELLRRLGGPWPGVVHRWSGPVELVADFAALGLHISLALEPRSDLTKRAALARAIPRERLLVESDWPFGELTYPQAAVVTRKLAEQIAEWRNDHPEDLLKIVRQNGRSLYLGAQAGQRP